MFLCILFSLIAGLFFLIGIYVLNKAKNKAKLANLTIAMASVVMSGLLLFDLLPEITEEYEWSFTAYIIIGFLFFFLTDLLIPHHHHKHNDLNDDVEDHNHHLNHIGTITILALGFHNFLEGMGLCSLTLHDYKQGFLMMISIGLHNIPLGFQIGNSLEYNKWTKYLILLLVISATLGTINVLHMGVFIDYVEKTCLSLTFGMMLYILVFELLRETIFNLKKKETIYGILIGIVVVILTNII